MPRFFDARFPDDLGEALTDVARALDDFFFDEASTHLDLSSQVTGDDRQHHVMIHVGDSRKVKFCTFPSRAIKRTNLDLQVAGLDEGLEGTSFHGEQYRTRIIESFEFLIKEGASTQGRFIKLQYDGLQDPDNRQRFFENLRSLLATVRQAARPESPDLASSHGTTGANGVLGPNEELFAAGRGRLAQGGGELADGCHEDRYAPTADPGELDARVEELLRHGLADIPPGTTQPQRITGQTSGFQRDPRVKAWILQTAEGRCEGCSESAPFVRANGDPYLEVHHVVPLTAGGPDVTTNAVALCPNCHRRCHQSADALSFTEGLYERTERLVRLPFGDNDQAVI